MLPTCCFCRHLVFDPRFVMPVKFIVVLLVLSVKVLSNTITADTTSGRLLGTQTDGGRSCLLVPVIFFAKVMLWTSRIFQRHCKTSSIFVSGVT